MRRVAGVVLVVLLTGCGGSVAKPAVSVVTPAAFRAHVVAMYRGLHPDITDARLSAARLDGFATAVARMRAPDVEVVEQGAVVSAARDAATAYRHYKEPSIFAAHAQTPDVGDVVSATVALREAVQAL